jgi:hypothetical protein
MDAAEGLGAGADGTGVDRAVDRAEMGSDLVAGHRFRVRGFFLVAHDADSRGGLGGGPLGCGGWEAMVEVEADEACDESDEDELER